MFFISLLLSLSALGNTTPAQRDDLAGAIKASNFEFIKVTGGGNKTDESTDVYDLKQLFTFDCSESSKYYSEYYALPEGIELPHEDLDEIEEPILKGINEVDFNDLDQYDIEISQDELKHLRDIYSDEIWFRDLDQEESRPWWSRIAKNIYEWSTCISKQAKAIIFPDSINMTAVKERADLIERGINRIKLCEEIDKKDIEYMKKNKKYAEELAMNVKRSRDKFKEANSKYIKAIESELSHDEVNSLDELRLQAYKELLKNKKLHKVFLFKYLHTIFSKWSVKDCVFLKSVDADKMKEDLNTLNKYIEICDEDYYSDNNVNTEMEKNYNLAKKGLDLLDYKSLF